MENKGGKEKEIISFASEKNILINQDAIEVLAGREDYKELIEGLVQDGDFVVSADSVGKLIRDKGKSKDFPEAPKVEVRSSRFMPIAKDIEPDFKVMEEYDITGKSGSRGKVQDFLDFFRDRYTTLAAMIKSRQGLDIQPIARIKKSQTKEVDFVGMIRERWVSKNGHTAFKVEDLDSECIVLVLKKDVELNRFADALVIDDVIGVKGAKLSDDLVIAKTLVLPEMSQKALKVGERDLTLVPISDLHIGSKLFLEEEFTKFLSWINGRIGSAKDLERIGKIKYITFCGDNVDGIGVYPAQFDELAIKDIYGQYEVFSKLVEQIPDYIEVFICPGQHDAVRRADPQPAIPKEFVKGLAERENMHFIGSPGWIDIEGLKCMMYHGASLHDLYSTVSFLDRKKPHKAMIEMLKRRNLMPGYGVRQPYVPEKKDFSIIREEPNFYLGADMHTCGYGIYRGCMVVCSSTWQKQTDFQVSLGHVPTPGIVPEISLKEMRIRENHFCGEGDDA